MRTAVALVTGAGGGIGRELALGLARTGVRVGLLGRDAARLAAVVANVEAAGGSAVAVSADVTEGASVSGAVAEVERALGSVDLLVNAAGRIESVERPVWDSDADEWWSVVETNLRGPFLLARAVVPGMIRRGGGRIVDLSSGFAARDDASYSAYSASKTGLLRLGAALDLAGTPHGVRCFEVAPGVVRTPMTDGMQRWEGAPPQRFTPVSAVVDLVCAIAAGELDGVSGRYLRADRDDVATLRAEEARIVAAEGRTLRVRPWGRETRCPSRAERGATGQRPAGPRSGW